MQLRQALHRQCIGVHRLYDIRSLVLLTLNMHISCSIHVQQCIEKGGREGVLYYNSFQCEVWAKTVHINAGYVLWTNDDRFKLCP